MLITLSFAPLSRLGNWYLNQLSFIRMKLLSNMMKFSHISSCNDTTKSTKLLIYYII